MKYLKKYESFTIDINVNININQNEFEYQYRDIDVGVWYKREKGTEVWSFISEEVFDNNATEENTVKWEE